MYLFPIHHYYLHVFISLYVFVYYYLHVYLYLEGSNIDQPPQQKTRNKPYPSGRVLSSSLKMVELSATIQTTPVSVFKMANTSREG